MMLDQRPLRFEEGVPVLASGRSYRFRGRLTCRIDGHRRPAPRGTLVTHGVTARADGRIARAPGVPRRARDHVPGRGRRRGRPDPGPRRLTERDCHSWIVATSVFREAELRYLAGGRQLGRIATVGADGTPHVVPVAFIYNAVRDAIDIGGSELEQSKKFRDVARTGRAAIVIDDLASTDPWHPRGIEIRGAARRSRCRRR